jgi:hypothetical protein
MDLLQYTAEPLDGYLRINVTGRFSFKRVMDLVQAFRDETIDAGKKRLLVDCSDMAGTITESDKFFIAEKIAMTLRNEVRAVVIMPVGRVTKLGELVAVNRGADFFVTDSEVDALKWLLGPPD